MASRHARRPIDYVYGFDDDSTRCATRAMPNMPNASLMGRALTDPEAFDRLAAGLRLGAIANRRHAAITAYAKRLQRPAQ